MAEWTQGPRIPPLESTYTSVVSDKCNSTAIGLTTLCDGWPRASHLQENCITSTSLSVATYSTIDCINYPTWTSEYVLPPSPTCTIATDYGSMCTRVAEVYDSLTDRYLASSVKPEESITIENNLRAEAPPCAVVTDTLTAGATPTCQIIQWSYEAYYWPTATPTGTAFCSNNTNNRIPTATGTATASFSETPVTTVVSGHTLTSPSVYHFIHDLAFKSKIGFRSTIGDLDVVYTTVFASPTTIGQATPIAISQLPDDLLRQTITCNSRIGTSRQCYYYNVDDLELADLGTVRANKATEGAYPAVLDGTIYQDQYKPTIALPKSLIAEQYKGVGAECSFRSSREGSGRRSQTRDPALVKSVEGSDFHKITMKAADVEAKETTLA